MAFFYSPRDVQCSPPSASAPGLWDSDQSISCPDGDVINTHKSDKNSKRFGYILRKITQAKKKLRLIKPVVTKETTVNYITPNKFMRLPDQVDEAELEDQMEQSYEQRELPEEQRVRFVEPKVTIGDIIRNDDGIACIENGGTHLSSETYTHNAGVQACSQIVNSDESLQIDSSDYVAKEIFTVPCRSAINKITKKKKRFLVYSKLLNFLRTKHFLKIRNTSLINQLVIDARVWLMKNGCTTESPDDYELLATAVTIAFTVQPEELKFRAVIKNDNNLDNMTHLNKTLIGDLGKKFRPPGEHTFIGGFLPSVALNAPQITV